MGYSDGRSDQILESINNSSRRVWTLVQVATITTSTGNINNYDDVGINETHDYRNEEEGVNIDDEDEVEEIISVIDGINW